MAAPAIATRLSQELINTLPAHLAPERNVRALVVSSEVELRKPLLRTLESLKIDTIVCASLAPAEEILSKQNIDVVFCDDYLPDGSYSDLVCGLVRLDRAANANPRVVVTTRTGDWDLYFAALAKGAFDVIQCPCYARDVEMAIGRVLREENFGTASR